MRARTVIRTIVMYTVFLPFSLLAIVLFLFAHGIDWLTPRIERAMEWTANALKAPVEGIAWFAFKIVPSSKKEDQDADLAVTGIPVTELVNNSTATAHEERKEDATS
jgi:amino acid permease